MRPLFSIITVTYNAEATIAATLQSVARQSCTLYEHIIVDGASSDGTLGILKDHASDAMKVVSQPDKGIYDAMNTGLSMASGDYVIFLNSGDRFHSSDTLQHMANAIMDNDYPGIVYGQTDLVDLSGHRLGSRHLEAPEVLTLDSLREGMVVCHQSMAVLKRIASFYNLKYKYSSDFEWLLICLQHSRANIYIPEVITDYLSEGMTTRHHFASLRERFSIMSTYFGFWPTVWSHIKFIPRYLSRRRSAPNVQ